MGLLLTGKTLLSGIVQLVLKQGTDSNHRHQTIGAFCEILASTLERPTDRSFAIPVVIQVCVFLRFLHFDF
jgi:hypothetical protein